MKMPSGMAATGKISQAAGNKQAKTIAEVIDRLEQELADVAVLDVGGDLPVVLVHGGQGIHDGDER